MPKRFVFIPILLLAISASADSFVEFDGETYALAWSTTQGTTELTEFLRPDESLSSWTQMISLRTHQGASRVSDVMKPYIAARKPLLVGMQLFKKQESPHAEDHLYEFMLLAPDSSHHEFVLVHAFSDPGKPVTLHVFSKRIPIGRPSETEARLSRVKSKRNDWYREIQQIAVRTIESQAALPQTGPDSLPKQHSVACAVATFVLPDTTGSLVARYWPPKTFYDDAERDGRRQDWYSTQLCAMGELPLWRTVQRGRPVLRFLWLRSFQPAIAIRVFEGPTGHRLVAIRIINTDGYPSGTDEAREVRDLASDEWSNLLGELERIEFWDLSTTEPSSGRDGARWIIEATDGHRYHIVDRWNAGVLEALGRKLIDLSGLDPDPIY